MRFQLRRISEKIFIDTIVIKDVFLHEEGLVNIEIVHIFNKAVSVDLQIFAVYKIVLLLQRYLAAFNFFLLWLYLWTLDWFTSLFFEWILDRVLFLLLTYLIYNFLSSLWNFRVWWSLTLQIIKLKWRVNWRDNRRFSRNQHLLFGIYRWVKYLLLIFLDHELPSFILRLRPNS